MPSLFVDGIDPVLSAQTLNETLKKNNGTSISLPTFNQVQWPPNAAQIIIKYKMYRYFYRSSVHCIRSAVCLCFIFLSINFFLSPQSDHTQHQHQNKHTDDVNQYVRCEMNGERAIAINKLW